MLGIGALRRSDFFSREVRSVSFSRLHPLVNLIYFAAVLGVAMFVEHPLIQLAGLLLSALLAACCVGARALLRRGLMILPVMLFTALLNPLISHQGVTVLFYFPSGNVCTLESVLFGVFAGVRMGTVLFWFVSWNRIITSDKFVYLFGRLIPALALTISMGLRFLPRLLRRFREVSDAQKCLYPQNSRLRHAGRVVSIVVTWALENALDTADSMKSRGYGLPGRSAFSLYRFTARDAASIAILLVCGGAVLAAVLSGALSWLFYPSLQGKNGIGMALGAAFFLLLAGFPLFFEAKEALQWRALKSKT